MQQGGYVSQSSGSKQLTVTKKSNVLDKGNKSKSSASNNGNGADNSSSGGGGGGGTGVSVSIRECSPHHPTGGFNWFALQESDLKEALDEMRKTNEENTKIKDEIRKLKAVIVKHENRIRALEAEKEQRDNVDSSNTAADSNNNGGDSQMAPDEV